MRAKVLLTVERVLVIDLASLIAFLLLIPRNENPTIPRAILAK